MRYHQQTAIHLADHLIWHQEKMGRPGESCPNDNKVEVVIGVAGPYGSHDRSENI